MDVMARFIQYAADFELTYKDDDWERLEAYFTDDAVYDVEGDPPLGGRWEGRKALLEHIRSTLDTFDRTFEERILEVEGAPRSGDGWVEVDWKAIYRKGSLPDLEMRGSERATFEGDRIRLLEDRTAPGMEDAIREYVAKYLR